MIHIKKSKDNKFYVVVLGENSEVLSTSELLNSKQAARKNIAAQEKVFQNIRFGDMVVQDDSLKKPKK